MLKKKKCISFCLPFVCFSGPDFTTCQQLTPCGSWGWKLLHFLWVMVDRIPSAYICPGVERTFFSKYIPYHFPLTKFPNIISAGKAEHKPFVHVKQQPIFPVTVRRRADKVKLTYLMTEIWKTLWGWNYHKINKIKLRKMHKVQNLNFLKKSTAALVGIRVILRYSKSSKIGIDIQLSKNFRCESYLIIFCLHLKDSTYTISQYIKRISVVCWIWLLKPNTVFTPFSISAPRQLLAYIVF